MKYKKIVKGKFINRPNRFIANVKTGEKTTTAHVKNTGRLGELLKEGADVFLEDHVENMGSRKHRYSLVGVTKPSAKEDRLVNIDSQAPNKVVKEALEDGRLLPCGVKRISYVKAEYMYGDSRLDFYVEGDGGEKLLTEVKGVTLEENGIARFPDAPTERGIRHIEELIHAVEEGYRACIVFVIQMMGVVAFSPSDAAHPQFGEALVKAASMGVEVLARDCMVDEMGMRLDEPVKVTLGKHL